MRKSRQGLLILLLGLGSMMPAGCGESQKAAGKGADQGGSAGTAGTAGDTSSAGAAGDAASGGASNSGSGGSTGTAGGTPYASGTRLKVRLGISSDGVEIPLGLHDSELGFDCLLRETSDGVRCLPSAQIFSTSFLDDQCETEGHVFADDCELPELVTLNDPGPVSCHGLWTSRAFSFGAQTDNGQQFEQDSCSETAYDPEQFTMHELVEEPLGRFATLEIEALAASDDGEQLLRAVSDDGASWPLTLAVAGQSCQYRELEGGDFCWAGGGAVYSSVFSDDTCTVPAAYEWSRNADCPTPTHVLVSAPGEPAGCQGSTTVYEVSKDLGEGAPVFADNGSCVDISSPQTSVYELGDGVSASALPELSKAEVGEGRLRRLQYHFAAGPSQLLAFPPRAFDSELSDNCSVTRFRDGKLWCVPDRAVALTDPTQYHADAACSEPLAVVPDCGGEPPSVAVLSVWDQCVTSYVPDAAFRVGNEHSGTIYTGTPETCTEATRDDFSRYFSLTPVDAAQVLAGFSEELL